jgi:predicted ATP-grasp superfamily ATP-dependent carboligase
MKESAAFSDTCAADRPPEPDSSMAVPVLVLGSGLTANGAIRTLGRARIPIFCITPPGDTLCVRSRWHRVLPGAKGYFDPTALPEFLERLPLPRAVLMPCSDLWVTAVAGLPASLRERFPSSIPPGAVIAQFIDKWKFAELLDREAIPHPRTMLLESAAEMLALPDSCYEGGFLKPTSSQEFSQRNKVKGFLIKDKSDALAIMTRVQQQGAGEFPIMLQEYIPGPPSNHYFIDGFVDRKGRICALFARQRLRMWPPLLGNSTLMESVALDQVEGAIRTIERLWSAVPYRGIFSAEFKYDDRDGQFKILEVNARPWWYIEFAARSGVDVCTLAYRDALELPVDTNYSYTVGTRCIHAPYDFRAYHKAHPEWRKLLGWLRSSLSAEEAVFAWDDPLPALMHWSQLLTRHIRRGRL